MKNRKIVCLTVVFIIFTLFSTSFKGYSKNIIIVSQDQSLISVGEDQNHTLLLPDWVNGEYHNFQKTTDKLFSYEENFSDLVDVFSIGKSVLGRDIWCIRITNEKNNSDKYSCLIDGCIHGCEWESGEACLYLSEFLLINFERNSSIKKILNITNIYIVPLLNPDGREENIRWNENDIDLNRNFDVHFGKILSKSLRIGKLFGRIKIPGFLLPKIGVVSNCGRYAFSEPESQAIRDLMKSINYHDFSFYLNCHTACHNFEGASDNYYFSQYTINEQEKNVITHVKEWVNNSTEYSAYYQNYKKFGYGNSVDWAYKEFNVPSFVFEILSQDYEPYICGGKHDNLTHWMKTTLPVFMYLITNAENLNEWKIPSIQPILPKGIPPDPLGGKE